MTAKNYVKKLRREARETGADPVVMDYVRKRCPLWRRVVGAFFPSVTIAWENKYKAENLQALIVARKRAIGRAKAARG